MLIDNHHTDGLMTPQALSLVGDPWTTNVVPRLPATLAEQARVLKAFQRVAASRLTGPVTRPLAMSWSLSTRRLGAWAALICLADISQAAWRKRLHARNDWLLWRLGELRAVPEAPVPSVPRPDQRLLLVDASCFRQPGGTGDDWRLPLAYDLLAGRMHQVAVTDRRGGEHLARYRWQAGEVIVADRGYGSRRSVATARQQQAHVVVRIHPATFPLETESGQPFNVLRWLRQPGGLHGSGTAGVVGRATALACGSSRPRSPPRRPKPPAVARVAKAQKPSRRLTAPTLRRGVAPADHDPGGADVDSR